MIATSARKLLFDDKEYIEDIVEQVKTSLDACIENVVSYRDEGIKLMEENISEIKKRNKELRETKNL